MSFEHPDGTVFMNSTKVGWRDSFDLGSPQKAIVRDIYYVDDPKNPGGDCVRARVEIITRDRCVPVPPVRVAYKRFGIENLEEWNPRATKSQTNKLPAVMDTIADPIMGIPIMKKTEADKLDGDIVIVQFIDGNIYDGYITGFISHGKNVSGKWASTKDDGDRYLFQHNGVRKLIDKNGDFLMSNFKSELFDFITQNPKQTHYWRWENVDAMTETFGISMIWDSDIVNPSFKLERLGALKSTIKIDNDGFSIDTLDKIKVKTAQKAEIETESGCKVSVDGITQKISIETSSGSKIEIDGTTNKVTAQSVLGGKLDLDTGQTLGGGSHPLVHGDTLKSAFDSLCNTISTIAPGSPANNAAALILIKTAFSTFQSQIALMNSLLSKTN